MAISSWMKKGVVRGNFLSEQGSSTFFEEAVLGAHPYLQNLLNIRGRISSFMVDLDLFFKVIGVILVHIWNNWFPLNNAKINKASLSKSSMYDL